MAASRQDEHALEDLRVYAQAAVWRCVCGADKIIRRDADEDLEQAARSSHAAHATHAPRTSSN